MPKPEKPEQPNPALGDLDAETFRRQGYRAIDWIADFLARPDLYPVLSRVRPGDIRRQLPATGPEEGEPLALILDDFERVLVPGITHWNHPAFFAYFAISGSAPGILGELLAAGLNVNAMLWRTSPAATELEQVVLDWLRQWIGLPESFEGVVYDTASISSLVGIAAAREALQDLQIREQGMMGREGLPRLRLYISEQAHSSVEKAALLLGIGLQGVRKIPVDERFQMRPELLEEAVTGDLRAGWRPFCAVATVGTTSTTSVDPVGRIAEICRRHGLWLHVDAAYAGCAAILPEKRAALDGCEQADSLVVNPHKWLFTPVDFSAFYSRRLEVVRAAFSLVPEYLRTAEDDQVRNYMDYGPQLGRRLRALKLWMVMRGFGLRGLQGRIREHIRLAEDFAAWVDAQEAFERCAPTPFSTVCFRLLPPGQKKGFTPASTTAGAESADEINERLLESLNATGELFLSHTRLYGRVVLRLAIGNIRTTEAHLRRVKELLLEHAARLASAARDRG